MMWSGFKEDSGAGNSEELLPPRSLEGQAEGVILSSL